jgi:tetratricopeptide (TPR) repeat protein
LHPDSSPLSGRPIRINPTLLPAIINRGVACFAKKDYDRAIADYSAAIKLDPGIALASNNRGRVFLAQKEYGLAIADYDQAIQLKPDYAKALYWRGKAKQLNGDIAGGNADVGAAETIDRNVSRD